MLSSGYEEHEVDVLDELLCKRVQAWLNMTRAVDEYYNDRIRNCSILGDVERAIARFVASRFSASTIICEIGAGYAQLSILLSALGYCVLAFESDWRFLGAQFLVNTASVGNRQVTLVHGWYPDALADKPFDLLVASNVVNSGWLKRTSGDGLQQVLRGKPAVIDVRLWGRRRSDVECDELIAKIQSFGYKSQVVRGTVVYFWPEP